MIRQTIAACLISAIACTSFAQEYHTIDHGTRKLRFKPKRVMAEKQDGSVIFSAVLDRDPTTKGIDYKATAYVLMSGGDFEILQSGIHSYGGRYRYQTSFYRGGDIVEVFAKVKVSVNAPTIGLEYRIIDGSSLEVKKDLTEFYSLDPKSEYTTEAIWHEETEQMLVLVRSDDRSGWSKVIWFDKGLSEQSSCEHRIGRSGSFDFVEVDILKDGTCLSLLNNSKAFWITPELYENVASDAALVMYTPAGESKTLSGEKECRDIDFLRHANGDVTVARMIGDVSSKEIRNRMLRFSNKLVVNRFNSEGELIASSNITLEGQKDQYYEEAVLETIQKKTSNEYEFPNVRFLYMDTTEGGNILIGLNRDKVINGRASFVKTFLYQSQVVEFIKLDDELTALWSSSLPTYDKSLRFKGAFMHEDELYLSGNKVDWKNSISMQGTYFNRGRVYARLEMDGSSFEFVEKIPKTSSRRPRGIEISSGWIKFSHDKRKTLEIKEVKLL